MKKRILAVPSMCFYSIIVLCLIGIIIGSFFDFDISMVVANKTQLGTYFATFSPFFAYALFPAGGACLYVGLRKKGDSFKPLALILAVFGWFMAVYFSNEYFGKGVRPLFGYTPGESSPLLSVVCWLVWAILYSWVPFVVVRCVDDSDPDKLLAVGAALWLSSFAADAMMQWLKQVGSRPRPKYLLTLEDPVSEFRNWWQMIPNMAGTNDSYQSWPSGHMSIVCVLFSLPVLTDCIKIESARKPRVNLTVFFFVCVFILLCGYNRMHMTNHFLSDVCFGTLNTTLLTAGIFTVFLNAVERHGKEISNSAKL